MKKKKRKLGIKGIIAITILALFIYVFKSEFVPIFKEIRTTSRVTLFILAICGLLYNFVEGLSIKTLSDKMGVKISAMNGRGSSLYSAFFRVVSFGAATYISTIHYFKKIGAKTSHGYSISLINYIGQKIGILLSVIVFYLLNGKFMNKYFYSYRRYFYIGIIISLLIIAGLLVFSLSAQIHKRVLSLYRMDKEGKHKDQEKKLRETFRQIEDTTAGYVKSPSLFWAILLNMAKNFLWYLIPFIVYKGAYSYSFLDYASVISLSLCLIGVIPAPAGIGSTQFIYTLLFKALIPEKEALMGLFLFRYANFIIPVLAGGIIAAKIGKISEEEVSQGE